MSLKTTNISHSVHKLNTKLSDALALIVAFQFSAVIVKACTPASIFQVIQLSVLQFHLYTFVFSILIVLFITKYKNSQAHEHLIHPYVER